MLKSGFTCFAMAYASLNVAFCTSANAQEKPPVLMVGEWRGSYNCLQGKTGLTLIISKQSGENMDGYFHFYPPRNNEATKEGCYSITGKVDAQNQMTVETGRWITQPDGYVMVGLQGEIEANDKLLSGIIVAPAIIGAGCTSFSVKKQSVNTKPAAICLKSDTVASADRLLK